MNETAFNKLIGALGAEALPLVEKAVIDEIESLRNRLKRLEAALSEYKRQGDSLKTDVKTISPPSNGSTINTMREILGSSTVPMAMKDILVGVNKTKGEDEKIAPATITNYLSANKDKYFKKHGQKRWTTWSLIRNETDQESRASST